MYELVQRKELLLREAEQIDLFSLPEQEAEELYEEMRNLRSEVNILRGYIGLVEQLATAYLEALDEAQTFDLVKHTELELVYQEWSKLERALERNKRLKAIEEQLKTKFNVQ
jgi:DNA repair ATPase RecN